MALSTNEGCAAISDNGSGNLLFYTDGSRLYGPPPSNVVVNPPTQPLGGNSSSAHSAIIVPPAGGGALYHVFTVGDWDTPSHIGTVKYSTVSMTPSLALASPPTPLPFGPLRAAEKLAAIPHQDCRRYWVVSLNVNAANPGAGVLFAMRIDSDAGPSAANTVTTVYPAPFATAAAAGFCIKFSPDGSLLAICSIKTIELLNFNRATGAFTAHSQINAFPANAAAYGVEFSPDGRYLYFSGINLGYVRRHTIGVSGSGPAPFSSTIVVGSAGVPGPASSYRVGALQLGPNGKIYGALVNQPNLLEIGDPDNSNPAAVLFKPVATQAGGAPLNLNATCQLGLPTFTRIASDCADGCKLAADEVEAQIRRRVGELRNVMVRCTGEAPPALTCTPLDIPRIRPLTSISWGSSDCDCIEGDDTEVMSLTICNPYSNVTLSNLVVNELVVVDVLGQTVPALPDGSPSIELVPIGPYCFDDVAPCTCVRREFVLRLRGAPGGRYKILVRGICFDACLHGDDEACFAFNVCPD